MTAASGETALRSVAANRAAKRAKVAASREERVRDAFAAFEEAGDVPGSVWDAAVDWASVSGVCFADIAGDVEAVAPDGWNTDDIDAALCRAVDRLSDDYNGRGDR